MPSRSRSSNDPIHRPRLLADVGGTNARFALEVERGHLAALAILPCKDFLTLEEAIDAYRKQSSVRALTRNGLDHAAIAIANPVDGDAVRMTNYRWHFSIEDMRRRLGLTTLLVVNDFTALAMALPYLGAEDKVQIGHGSPRTDGVIGLLGAGTGLGVSGLIKTTERWVALGSEGGHTTFSPADEREIAILRHAWKEWDHVSVERLVSGPGLELTYRALAVIGRKRAPPLSSPEIARRALANECPICAQAIDAFGAMLGSFAGNVAMTLGALGGVYIGSGIAPRLGRAFLQSPFRQRFEAKGRLSKYMRRIPTYLITAEHPTFYGVAAILSEKLDQPVGGAPIVERIRALRPRMSPSEQRVADWVATDPRAPLTLPIAEIAARAEVSQPTVMRFCRALGFDGLSDFKLKLASSVTGTIPVAHSEVKTSDSMGKLSEKVLTNNAAATLALRDCIDAIALDDAVAALSLARRVELAAVGTSRVVAEDAQHKLMHVGIPTSFARDERTQLLGASMLQSDDVLLVISRSGAPPDLLEAARAAQKRRAKVVAIAAGRSPLAKLADILIAVDHEEGDSNYVPMILRLLHLMIIDILVVRVAQRGERRRGNGLDKFGTHMQAQ
jgi:glucokinase